MYIYHKTQLFLNRRWAVIQRNCNRRRELAGLRGSDAAAEEVDELELDEPTMRNLQSTSCRNQAWLCEFMGGRRELSLADEETELERVESQLERKLPSYSGSESGSLKSFFDAENVDYTTYQGNCVAQIQCDFHWSIDCQW